MSSGKYSASCGANKKSGVLFHDQVLSLPLLSSRTDLDGLAESAGADKGSTSAVNGFRKPLGPLRSKGVSLSIGQGAVRPPQRNSRHRFAVWTVSCRYLEVRSTYHSTTRSWRLGRLGTHYYS